MQERYQLFEGIIKKPEMTIYSLTYCGSCKDARDFLKEKGYTFKYIELDTLPPHERFGLKRTINPENKKDMLYPVLEINGEERLYGYNPDVWLDRISRYSG